QALDVVGVGVGGNDHLARGQVKIHLADEFHDLVNRFQVADVDEQEFAAAVDQVNVDPEPAAGLVVHLDDVGEKVFAREHIACHSASRTSSIRLMIGRVKRG